MGITWIRTLGESLKKPFVQGALFILVVALAILQVKTVMSASVADIWSWLHPPSQTSVEIRNIILSGIKDRNELTTAAMSTKATIHVSQDRKISRLSVGNTNLVYEGVGKVEAGIDLKLLEAKQVDPKNHKIHLVLPAPRITQAFVDINNSHVVVEYRKWWGPNAESDLKDEAQKKALAIIRAEACANQILDQAANHAKELVKEILTTSGYKEIIVDVKSNQAETCPTA